jgi:hypothetical protein
MEGPFVGTKDSCTGQNGGLISAIDLQYWDFEKGSMATRQVALRPPAPLRNAVAS